MVRDILCLFASYHRYVQRAYKARLQILRRLSVISLKLTPMVLLGNRTYRLREFSYSIKYQNKYSRCPSNPTCVYHDDAAILIQLISIL